MRRPLPLLLVAGLVLFLLLSAFKNPEWRWIPRAFGNGRAGPSAEDIKSGKNILPDLRKTSGFVEPKVDSTSPYPIGQVKPPGSNYTKNLIIAKMKDEDTDWIDSKLGEMINSGQLVPIIYVMDDPRAALHVPKNKGHEAMAYLTYIIDNYDELADINIFMHYHFNAWHNNELQYIDSSLMVRELSPERVTREGYMNLRCHWDPGCPAWLFPGTTTVNEDKYEEYIIAHSWTQMFPSEPIPKVLSQPCCAQFAVSRERIRMVPRERYISLREWAINADMDDYLLGRVFEYTWQYIFTAAPVHCPSMSVCYCDGYGYCFDGPENFDAWFEIRYQMEKNQDELRIWKSKAEKIELWREMQRNGSEVAEDTYLVIPEPGRDVWLQNTIDALGAKLLNDLHEAHVRGRDPKQRAKEAGRPWKEGDGF